MIEVPAPSPNRASRPPSGWPPQAVVIHDTGGKTAAGTLAWFRDAASGVSSHVVLDRDGIAYRCVPDEDQAWHAGASVLHGRANVNGFSLGLELVDDDDRSRYPAPQLAGAAVLVAGWCRRYRIPLNLVVGHQHVCVPPGRKVDPGEDFGWYAFLLAVAATIGRPADLE